MIRHALIAIVATLGLFSITTAGALMALDLHTVDPCTDTTVLVTSIEGEARCVDVDRFVDDVIAERTPVPSTPPLTHPLPS